MQDIDRLTSDVLAECKALSKKIIEILVATMNQTLREDKPYRKEKGLLVIDYKKVPCYNKNNKTERGKYVIGETQYHTKIK